MRNVTLCVLSRYADLFESFAANIHEFEPDIPRVLIRDGNDILTPAGPWRTFEGEQPFVYARNVNLAWRVTGDDDVILCGDDIRFESPFVEALRETAYSNHTLAISTVQLHGQSPFVCGYFPREIIWAVGTMDEQFTGYGKDDVDWCRRMEACGYSTQPTERVRAQHGGGTSFLRRTKELGTDMEQYCDVNNRLFEAKWRES